MDRLGPVILESLRAALKDYGAGVVLLIFAVIFLEWLLIHSFRQRLDDKDREIKRMADRNVQLEKLILKNRISTRPDPTQTVPVSAPSTPASKTKKKEETR